MTDPPLFILAPMDDVTDTVFRQIVAGCASPDLFVTEFVNVDGLQSAGRPRLIKKLRFAACEGRVVAQLWGKSPENFYKTAREIADGTLAQEFGLAEGVNFAGIDLNMGCPVKVVVRNGCCSALINDRDHAVEIIKATQEGAGQGMPVSVKTRLGFRDVDFSWPQLLLEQRLNMLTIHGRTVKQLSKVPADWEKIGQVRQMRDNMKLNTLIVGNGDVTNREQGTELAKKYNLDGIMIGRGIFHDPFAFAEHSPWPDYNKAERIALFRHHIELFAQTWQDGERRIETLNKFCKVYIQNFDGAKELREELMRAPSAQDALALLAKAGD